VSGLRNIEQDVLPTEHMDSAAIPHYNLSVGGGYSSSSTGRRIARKCRRRGGAVPATPE